MGVPFRSNLDQLCFLIRESGLIKETWCLEKKWKPVIRFSIGPDEYLCREGESRIANLAYCATGTEGSTSSLSAKFNDFLVSLRRAEPENGDPDPTWVIVLFDSPLSLRLPTLPAATFQLTAYLHYPVIHWVDAETTVAELFGSFHIGRSGINNETSKSPPFILLRFFKGRRNSPMTTRFEEPESRSCEPNLQNGY